MPKQPTIAGFLSGNMTGSTPWAASAQNGRENQGSSHAIDSNQTMPAADGDHDRDINIHTTAVTAQRDRLAVGVTVAVASEHAESGLVDDSAVAIGSGAVVGSSAVHVTLLCHDVAQERSAPAKCSLHCGGQGTSAVGCDLRAHRDVASTEREWECGSCTFLNTNADAPVCEVCRTERGPPTLALALEDARRSGVAVSVSVKTDPEQTETSSDAPLPTKQRSVTHIDSACRGNDSVSDDERGVLRRPAVRLDNKRRRVIGAFGGSLLRASPEALFTPRDGAIQPTPNRSLDGLYIVRDFIDEATEAALVAWIDGGDASNPWRRSRFNGKHMVKTWGVRTDFGTGTVRLPTEDEPHFPPPGGEMDVLIANLRRIDFGRLARTANGW